MIIYCLGYGIKFKRQGIDSKIFSSFNEEPEIKNNSNKIELYVLRLLIVKLGIIEQGPCILNVGILTH